MKPLVTNFIDKNQGGWPLRDIAASFAKNNSSNHLIGDSFHKISIGMPFEYRNHLNVQQQHKNMVSLEYQNIISNLNI